MSENVQNTIQYSDILVNINMGEFILINAFEYVIMVNAFR